MKTILRSSLWLLGIASLTSCGGKAEEPGGGNPGEPVRPISHSRAALSVATNTETALMGLTNAAGFLAESTAIAGTLNDLGGASDSCSSTAAVAPCPADGSPCPEPVIVEECETDELTTEDLQEARAEVEEGIAELVDELQARFFSEDNIETEEEKAITYLLGPEDVCGEITETTFNADGTYTEQTYLDPECVDSVTQAEIRLRVTSPSDGDVDVTVQLTDQRFEPFVFELHQKRLGITVDLGELTSSIEAMGEDLEGLESLSGQVQAELVENASLDYSFRYNVLEDLELVADDGEGNRLEASLGRSSPTTELRVDGNAKTITASYDYGALRLSGPLQMFADMFDGDNSSSGDVLVAPTPAEPGTVEGEVAIEPIPEPVPEEEDPVYTGMMEFLLGGLSGSFSFSGDTETFAFTDLGLGDETTTLTHDDNTLFALDVNENDGRRFDVTVHDTDSGVEFTFSPTLDVSLLFEFSHIADQLDVESALLSDRLHLWFDGNDPTIAIDDDQIRVASGTLHMTSSAAPEYDVEVAAGMCLIGTDSDDAESVPLGANVAPAIDPVTGEPITTTEPVPEPVEVEAEEEHFMSQLEVGACQ